MYRSTRSESKGLMDNVAGITASSMIVIFAFMLTITVMDGFAGNQEPAAPEIEMMYQDIAEVCSNTDEVSEGEIELGSTRSSESLTVCGAGNNDITSSDRRLCYSGSSYGSGDIQCETIEINCGGESEITGSKDYRVEYDSDTAMVTCPND